MKCKHCKSHFDIQSTLDTAEFSWPLRQMIWYVCSNCNNGNHLRFDNGIVQVVKLKGSPGYEYDVISSVKEPTIAIRVDPSYLHIWFHGQHNEIKERT